VFNNYGKGGSCVTQLYWERTREGKYGGGLARKTKNRDPFSKKSRYTERSVISKRASRDSASQIVARSGDAAARGHRGLRITMRAGNDSSDEWIGRSCTVMFMERGKKTAEQDKSGCGAQVGRGASRNQDQSWKAQ